MSSSPQAPSIIGRIEEFPRDVYSTIRGSDSHAGTPLQRLTRNGKFYSLSPAEQDQALSAVSPEYKGFSDSDKSWFVGQLNGRWKSLHPSFEKAIEGVVGPGSGIYKALDSPAKEILAPLALGPILLLHPQTPAVNLEALHPSPGAAHSALGFASGLTTPMNVAMLAGAGGLVDGAANALLGKFGARAVRVLIDAGFAKGMLQSALKAAKQVETFSKEGRTDEARGALANFLLSAGFGSLTGYAALHNAFRGLLPGPLRPDAISTPSPGPRAPEPRHIVDVAPEQHVPVEPEPPPHPRTSGTEPAKLVRARNVKLSKDGSRITMELYDVRGTPEGEASALRQEDGTVTFESAPKGVDPAYVVSTARDKLSRLARRKAGTGEKSATGEGAPSPSTEPPHEEVLEPTVPAPAEPPKPAEEAATEIAAPASSEAPEEVRPAAKPEPDRAAEKAVEQEAKLPEAAAAAAAEGVSPPAASRTPQELTKGVRVAWEDENGLTHTGTIDALADEKGAPVAHVTVQTQSPHMKGLVLGVPAGKLHPATNEDEAASTTRLFHPGRLVQEHDLVAVTMPNGRSATASVSEPPSESNGHQVTLLKLDKNGASKRGEKAFFTVPEKSITAIQHRELPATPQTVKATGTKARIIPTRSGVVAVPIEEPAATPAITAQAAEPRPAPSETAPPETATPETAPAAPSSAPTEAAPEPSPAETPSKPERPAPQRQVAIGDAHDYHITEADKVGTLGPIARGVANIRALQTLAEIEKSGKPATREQQALLVQYSGWAGLPYPITYAAHNEPAGWAKVRQAASGLLTKAELAAIERSTLDAFYTSPEVIQGIWRALSGSGIAGDSIERIRVLEPSAGVGHFFGLMPREVARRSAGVAYEMDKTTSRIAQALYPSVKVFNAPFQDNRSPNGFFDLVVGNVPFGNFPVYDPGYRNLRAPVHDYFLIKSLDLTRPGGLVALITSHGTMDKESDAFRSEMRKRADLVAAVRLPSSAFKGNAGTSVTTDVLLFAKRDPRVPASGAKWLASVPFKTQDGETRINEYFAGNPNMMLGEMRLTGSMYRKNEPELHGPADALGTRIAEALAPHITPALFVPRESPGTEVEPLAALDAGSKAKMWSYEARGGKIVQITPDGVKSVTLTPERANRARALIALRDQAHETLALQLSGAPETERVEARRKLNALYDTFRSRHGAIALPSNAGLLPQDPHLPLLLSLETDANAREPKKSAIFERDTVTPRTAPEHIEDAHAAMLTALNITGKIDWNTISNLTGRPIEALQTELAGRVFNDPERGWQTAETYLSGNVRQKLRTAQQSAAIDPSFAGNVAALQAVLPKDLTPAQILPKLGVPWVPPETVAAFMSSLYGGGARFKVHYSPSSATWRVESEIRHPPASEFDSTSFAAHDLVVDALNQRRPTVYRQEIDANGEKRRVVDVAMTESARAQQKKIEAEFNRWLWSDPARAEALAKTYNDTMNALVKREYTGDHLTFPGLNPSFIPNKAQRGFVARTLEEPNTIAVHQTGVGKTAAAILSVMEGRRLGLIKKALITSPLPVVKSGHWRSEFQKLYPGAKVLFIGEGDLDKAHRQVMMSRIATGDWDAVVVPHPSFERLSVRPETWQNYLSEQLRQIERELDEARREHAGARVIKDLLRARESQLAKLLKHGAAEKKDTGLHFEDLGVDALYVDESHLFKNLYYPTKQGSVLGAATSASDRASDMLLKVRHVQSVNGGGGVRFLTATPLARGLGEVYNLQVYLTPKVLNDLGLAHFDAWTAQFGDIVTAAERTAGSSYKIRSRLAQFRNAPELSQLFQSFADVRSSEDAGIKTPALETGKPVVVESAASPELKEYIETLDRRMGDLRSEKAGMLTINQDGRRAALDMRLIDPGLPGDPNSKLPSVAKTVADIYRASTPQKGTQLIFLDVGVAPPVKERTGFRGFNPYLELRQLLEDHGIPRSEIEFVQDHSDEDAKKALFERVNTGDVRVVVGSTPTLGTGVNVQRLAVAAHNVDATQNPDGMTQREGRIVRQGNLNDTVKNIIYITRGSFDAPVWQMLERKQKMYENFIRGNISERVMENVIGRTLTAAEIHAVATGDPRVMRRFEVLQQIEEIERASGEHQRQTQAAAVRLGVHAASAASLAESARAAAQDAAAFNAHQGPAEITVGGQRYTEPKAINEALVQALRNAPVGVTPIGRANGFPLQTRGVYDSVSQFTTRHVEVLGASGVHYPISVYEDLPGRTVRGISELGKRAAEEAVDYARKANLERQSADALKKVAESPFDREAELDTLLNERDGLDTDLGIKQDAAITEGDEEPETPPDTPGEEDEAPCQ